MARLNLEVLMVKQGTRVAEHNEPEIVDVSVTPQRDRDGRPAWVVGEYKRTGEGAWHTVYTADVSIWHPGGRR